MSLRNKEVSNALDLLNISHAVVLGVHENCPYESNCPLSISLRRIVAESGVTLEAIEETLHTYNERAETLFPNPAIRAISEELELNVMGALVKVPIEQCTELPRKLKEGLILKMKQLDDEIQRVFDYTLSIQAAYTRERFLVRNTQKLIMLDYNPVMSESEGLFVYAKDNCYNIAFNLKYNPQYIIDNGERYEILKAYEPSLKHDWKLVFTITADFMLVKATVMDRYYQKMVHYHGTASRDCWGSIRIEGTWDRSMETLRRKKAELEGALTTINYNSLYTRNPAGMPPIDDLRRTATKLGREGGEVTRVRRSTRTLPVAPVANTWGELIDNVS